MTNNLKAKGYVNQREAINPDEEAAAAKLWAVYVSEAERYDRGLVESWKSDMEGLLIFAALFSAILTAFLIESYKSLNPDSGGLTVQLLAQISQQLASSANGSTFQPLPSASFTPPASSLICNGLWFLSLGFSLACALIATFVQQWARDFLHKAEMRSAPVIRARIFSYLYYGLKRFRMHTVVEIIPLLLHGSLLLFFSGLVAFLLPVNTAMTFIASIVLAMVSAVYCTVTLLPLLYLDCPYRTPLSAAFWMISHGLRSFWHRRSSQSDTADEPGSSDGAALEFQPSPTSHDETMVEAMSRTAWETRSGRDYKALVWTMKSLTDDVELEPFIEAIPDLLWGPTYRRRTYEVHILGLIHSHDVQLLLRIAALLDSCYTGLLPSHASQRRIITCCKALWAIAGLSKSQSSSFLWNDRDNRAWDLARVYRRMRETENSDIAPYLLSARTVMLSSTFDAVEGDLIKFRDYLATCEDNPKNEVELVHITDYLVHVRSKFYAIRGPDSLWLAGPPDIENLRNIVEEYLSEIPFRIIMEFLSQSAHLGSPPYYLEETRRFIRASRPVPISLRDFVETKMDDAILSQMHRFDGPEVRKTDWIDDSITELMSFWSPDNTYRIPRGLIALLNYRPSLLNHQIYQATSTALRVDIKIHLWDCFQKKLTSQTLEMQSEWFTALWGLASIGLLHYTPIDSPQYLFDSALRAVSATESPFGHITCSVIALLKAEILRDLDFTSMTLRTMEDTFLHLNHHLFPAESAMPVPEEFRSIPGEDEILREHAAAITALCRHRLLEARIDVVAVYLEHYASDVLPYNVIETLNRMKQEYITPEAPIHPTIQIRLANSIHRILSDARFIDLSDIIINLCFWDLYAAGDKSEWEIQAHREELSLTLGAENGPYERGPSSTSHFWPWLDAPVARQKVKDAFKAHEMNLMFTTESARDVLLRLRRMLKGINCWHPS